MHLLPIGKCEPSYSIQLTGNESSAQSSLHHVECVRVRVTISYCSTTTHKWAFLLVLCHCFFLTLLFCSSKQDPVCFVSCCWIIQRLWSMLYLRSTALWSEQRSGKPAFVSSNSLSCREHVPIQTNPDIKWPLSTTGGWCLCLWPHSPILNSGTWWKLLESLEDLLSRCVTQARCQVDGTRVSRVGKQRPVCWAQAASLRQWNDQTSPYTTPLEEHSAKESEVIVDTETASVTHETSQDLTTSGLHVQTAELLTASLSVCSLHRVLLQDRATPTHTQRHIYSQLQI